MSGHDLWATAMGQWCDDLADLMLPFERIALLRSDLLCMGAATPGFARAMGVPCPALLSDTLCADVENITAQFPRGAHLRLDLCSFKSAQGTPGASDAATALAVLMQPNPRVAGLIKRGLDDKMPLGLFAFAWRDIPAWCEFRIFVRAGRVVGISQADAQQSFPELSRHAAQIEPGLWGFAQALLPRLPLPDVVVDVFAEMTPGQGWKIWLIELNPFVQRSDPGLFTWQHGGDFDGKFRYTSAGAAPVVAHPAVPATASDDDIWRI